MEKNIINEILRECLDPVIFCERFLKVDTPDGRVPWRLDPYQKAIMHDRSRFRIINKSKKVGVSTTIAGEGLFKTMTTPNIQVIYVSTGEKIAKELLGKTYDLLYSMPPMLQPYGVVKRMEKESAEAAQFSNGSRIISLPSRDPGHIRGFGLRGIKTDVYVDEYAHVINDRELWIVIRDFAILGGNITLISTPKGKRGKFAELVEPLQAVHRGLTPKQSTEWSYHEIPYTMCLRLVNQEKFLRAGMTEEDFMQEYLTELVDESISFFPYELIWKCQHVKEMVLERPTKALNPITFGVDFGKKVSETVIYVVEEYSPEHYRTLWIEVLPGVDYPHQCDIIKSLDNVFDPLYINVDATGPGGQTMLDFLQTEKYCGHKVVGYNLMPQQKESLATRTRILMNYGGKDRGFIELPTRDNVLGEKLEMQIHSIQRTTTVSGEHTRFSGKETGMDDMFWALALAVWKENPEPSEPFLEVYQDPVLKKLLEGR